MTNPFAGRGGPEDAWYDENAGPIVRLYAMTSGRAGDEGDEFTVGALISRTGDHAGGTELSAEKSAILRLCAHPVSVAEIAAHLALPLGTVKALLADLRGAGLVQLPSPPAEGHSSEHLMRRLHDGLRAL